MSIAFVFYPCVQRREQFKPRFKEALTDRGGIIRLEEILSKRLEH